MTHLAGENLWSELSTRNWSHFPPLSLSPSPLIYRGFNLEDNYEADQSRITFPYIFIPYLR